MKRILFVMPKFASGGAEKSLLMLLYTLSERNDLEIDLLLFKKEGIFLKQLPSNINVLEGDSSLKCAYSKFNIRNFENLFDFVIAVIRPISTLLCSLFSRTYNERSQWRWKYCYKKLIHNMEKSYDIACGYLDGEAIYYIIDKVTASKKIGWNQNDYLGQGFNRNMDIEYYHKLDKIVTLTDECEKVLKKIFPDCQGKIKQLPPIVSYSYIQKCANEFIPEEYQTVSETKIVSVGRLVEQKGFDIAVDTAEIMKKNRIPFKWYIIGDGELRKTLKNLIREKGLENQVYLLGEKPNPYPYLENADIFVQPSRFEGKSVILNEVMMLCKPIIVTNYLSATDQITNMKNGLIVEMNSKALFTGIERMIHDSELRQNFISNLMKTDWKNDSVIYEYMRLFEICQNELE